MLVIHFPAPSFRIRQEAGRELIYDSWRKKWVVLTPEEWVRQNFINYLVHARNYPAGLIAVEKEIKLGELTKRFDILVYDREHRPWMMVECKSMDIPLDEEVLQQALRYNLGLPVSYIIISNGRYSRGWERSPAGLQELMELPGMPG